MNSLFRKLAVESLEGRSVLSTFMVEADFNGDGYADLAALTDPNKITVSLFDPVEGDYEVSAILTTPKNAPMESFSVFDVDQDGDQDITSSTPKGGSTWDIHQWLNDGDGTFSSPTTRRWRIPKSGGWF